ncbi:hypothetical protein EW026_g4671 [Hermanssonia centrifuga]|uniref:Uncharacterized protein n=1 Tax=Hermanssonia centrifuga TaxID=98765 RepID=A0A4S4KH46_9APHY|nr:hypothetical protein EW026_g4671 [Hermanssonia centrifuga]
MLAFVFYAVGLLFSVAYAAPFQAEAEGPGGVLVVVDPKILTPTAQTTWVVGNQYNVTWDNTSLPPLVNITNVVGMVVLGQFNGDGEKLYLDDPLAQGFLLTDSFVVITCPDVDDGNYMIVLFGDSGNASPQFKITRNPISSLFDPGSSSSASSNPSSDVVFLVLKCTSLSLDTCDYIKPNHIVNIDDQQ